MTSVDTDRLSLRPVATADFDDLVALWSEPEFVRHITGRALTREEVWFRLLRDIGHWSALGYGNWVMRTRDDGTFVGTVGVLEYRRDLDPPFDSPELGWGVRPTLQGRGLAREGVAGALGWADGTLEAARTVCMIGPDNTASLRLAQKVGYSPFAHTTYKDQPVILLERSRVG